MSLSEAVWQAREAIVSTVHSAIIHAMLDTWSRCRQLNAAPQEPDFVAGLVLESCPLIHVALRSILSRRQIHSSMLAVYCHQTPKVTYSGISRASCELGDLLVAHIHTSAAGHIHRNALLYQAKVSSSQPWRVPRSDQDQLRLYVEWPDFEYYQSPPLTGERRCVTPKTVHPGAQYMLIDDRPPTDLWSGLLGMPGTYPIGSCMPDEWLHDHNHLAAEVLDFLLVRSGRPFADRGHAFQSAGWSRLVWDLLDAGVRKAFNRKRSGHHQRPRAAGDVRAIDGHWFAQSTSAMAYSTVADILGPQAASRVMSSEDSELPPAMPRNNEGLSEPESGVSVILLETRSGREE